MAHPDSENTSSSTFAPQEDCQQSRWCLSHCVPGSDIRLPGHRTQIKNHRSTQERMLGKSPDFYLINLFPEFQIPSLHLFPPYKKGLLGYITRVFSELKTASIKNQSLPLLIGSGGARQHERRLLWFHTPFCINGVLKLLSLGWRSMGGEKKHIATYPLSQQLSPTFCHFLLLMCMG